VRGNRKGSLARNNQPPAGDRTLEKYTFRGFCFQPGEKAGYQPDFFDRLSPRQSVLPGTLVFVIIFPPLAVGIAGERGRIVA